MNEDKFLSIYSSDWTLLESHLKDIKKNGITSFSTDKLEEFLNLYNKACSNLSFAKSNYKNSRIVDYLNNLVATCHGHIYSTGTSKFRDLVEFFRFDFPLLIKDNFGLFLISFLLFLAGTFVSFALTMTDVDNANVFLGDFVINVDLSKENSTQDVDNPVMSSFISTNNIKVGFLAYSLGFTAGIGTIIVLFINGCMLGSLWAVISMKGHSLEFWSLILPHGVLELFAIFVCGAAGFVIAKAIINPGRKSRMDALISSGNLSIRLILGTIPIFIIAGIIEGFFTPAKVSPYLKLAFALLTFILLIVYFWQATYFKKERA